MQQYSDSFGRAIHDRKPGAPRGDYKVHIVAVIAPSQNHALDLQYVIRDDVCVSDDPLLIALGGESVRQYGAAAVRGWVMKCCVGDDKDGSLERRGWHCASFLRLWTAITSTSIDLGLIRNKLLDFVAKASLMFWR